MTHANECTKNSKRRLAPLLMMLVVVLVAVAILLSKFIYPIYQPIIDSSDKALTAYHAFVFPIWVDRRGLIQTLHCYKTYPSGGGDYLAADPVSNPWPIVPAPLKFRWDPAAQEIGWVVRRRKPDIQEPDDRDVRVHWMTADEVQDAIRKGKIIIPPFASLPRFDLSRIKK